MSPRFLRLAAAAIVCSLTGLWFAISPGGSQEKTKDDAKNKSDFATIGVPFLTKHCIHCHGTEKKKAGLAFHLYKDDQAVIKDRKVFQSILNMVRAGEMPPQDRPRPAVNEADAFAQLIQEIFNKADRDAPRDPGQVTMRRLNRYEFQNTVRDLFGVEFDANELPQDDVGYGFDNIGDVLTISPLLMERYLAVSESIVQRAFPIEPPKYQTRNTNARFLEPAINPDSIKQFRTVTSGKLFTSFKVGQGGEFKMRVRCYALQLGNEPVRIALELDGKDLKTFDVKAVAGKPEILEVPVTLKRGEYKGAVRFINDYSEKEKAPEPEKIPDKDKKTDKPAEKDKKTDKGKAPEKEKKRTLFVEWLELNGPLDSRPESQQKILAGSDGLDKKEKTLKVLTKMASLAYRRPAAPEEIARLVTLVEKVEARGDKWEAGMQLALQALLCSPKFLFRVELDQRPDSAAAHPIDEYQLASRLSYFLWSTMPDEELFALAQKKELQKSIEAQVVRMLKDPRARALVDNFAMQWLQLRTLKNFNPDAKLFPEWDESLRNAALKETELFLKDVFSEDRSILTLIDADFTFLNDRLARHYGMSDALTKRKGFPGNRDRNAEFQRVTLKGAERGGLLTQASILAVNSNPTRTSPVKRGRWVLEQILGTPPPPPPPDVPQLAEGEKAQTQGSLRQRMEQHRANASCAFCHARMDPIGFAFEHYDAVGKFRIKDGEYPIDASGTLPNGQSFKGPAELKVILKSRKELFSRNLSEKMLTYALGRGLEYYDRAAVDAIVATLDRNDYRFSVLVTEIVKSDPFRLRRGKDQK